MVLIDKTLQKSMEQLSLSTTLNMSYLRYLDLMEFNPIFTDDLTSKVANPAEGIRQYGPYDLNTQDTSIRRKFNSIEVFAFYPRSDIRVSEGLRKLITYLNKGYNERRTHNDTSFQGLAKEFWLDSVVLPCKETNFYEYEIGSLGALLDKLVPTFEQTFRRRTIPLAIVGGMSHKTVKAGQEQYREAKKEFAAREIPCQYASYFEHETGGVGILYNVSNPENSFGYSLWNFSLDIYGKLGGLAWVVPQRLSEDEQRIVDLSIGLRFARIPSQGGNKGRFYVGYATIVDKFGRWVGVASSDPFLIEPQTPGMVVPKEDMRKLIASAIELAKTSKRTGGLLRERPEVIITIFRLDRFHPSETEGIFEAAGEALGVHKGRIGMVSIVSKPVITLLEEAPKKGVAVQINKKAFLLYTSSKRPGAPIYPIVVKAENLDSLNSPFQNLTEVANHILAACTLHWQTVTIGSSRLPAPLSFAHNIAYLSSIGAQPPKNSWLWDTLWFI